MKLDRTQVLRTKPIPAFLIIAVLSTIMACDRRVPDMNPAIQVDITTYLYEKNEVRKERKTLTDHVTLHRLEVLLSDLAKVSTPQPDKISLLPIVNVALKRKNGEVVWLSVADNRKVQVDKFVAPLDSTQYEFLTSLGGGPTSRPIGRP